MPGMATNGASSPSPSFRRVLLAVELSATPGAPEVRALALAAELRASLVVISVLESKAHMPVTPRRVDQLREVHERAAHDLTARGKAMGVDVNYLIWQGDAADSIIEAAGSELVDLIVIGTPTHNGSTEPRPSGVADEILRRASVPVLVVPDPARMPAAPT
jgi:nucleotide-binding universal stress UspA family protein